MILIIIFTVWFICITVLSILFIRIMHVQVDHLTASAHMNLNALYLKVEAKQILYLTILLSMILAFLALLIFDSIFLLVVFSIVGAMIPKLFFKIQKDRRREKINSQLITAVEMLANSLHAGRTLPQAISLVKDEMNPPISQDFSIVLKQMQMGLSLEKALNDMADRINSTELEIVVNATKIGVEAGGNLAEVYERIAKTMRKRVEMIGKIKALTAEGKMQAIVVGAMPFLMFITLLVIEPELMRPMLTTHYGHMLIAIVLIMECIGTLIIKKLITIDV